MMVLVVLVMVECTYTPITHMHDRAFIHYKSMQYETIQDTSTQPSHKTHYTKHITNTTTQQNHTDQAQCARLWLHRSPRGAKGCRHPPQGHPQLHQQQQLPGGHLGYRHEETRSSSQGIVKGLPRPMCWCGQVFCTYGTFDLCWC